VLTGRGVDGMFPTSTRVRRDPAVQVRRAARRVRGGPGAARSPRRRHRQFRNGALLLPRALSTLAGVPRRGAGPRSRYRRARAGGRVVPVTLDGAGIERLYRSHGHIVLGRARLLLGNDPDAAEA